MMPLSSGRCALPRLCAESFYHYDNQSAGKSKANFRNVVCIKYISKYDVRRNCEVDLE
jgi:hypothetical protein